MFYFVNFVNGNLYLYVPCVPLSFAVQMFVIYVCSCFVHILVSLSYLF